MVGKIVILIPCGDPSRSRSELHMLRPMRPSLCVRTPRIRSRTPVVGDRASSTVASGPNQVRSLYLRTSSRIPSLGIIRVAGVTSRDVLGSLAERMAVVGHQDAAQYFLAGQFFPFRFVSGSLGEAELPGVSVLGLSRRRT